MKLVDKEGFLKKSRKTLDELLDMLNSLPDLKSESLTRKNTALIMIDVVNGFTREGALRSARIENLIAGITELSRKCDSLGISKLILSDYHSQDSQEFSAYPIHCVSGSDEIEVVDEIKEVGGYKQIRKNSTNGFIEEEFQEWLHKHPEINTFIITGDCTDICIQQFAVTMKTWFNMKNLSSRIIVPINLVDTFDLGVHNGDLMNVMGLYQMMCNGVEIVGELK